MTDCTSCKAASALDGLPCPWAGHGGYPAHPRGCENVASNPSVWIPETVRTAQMRASSPPPRCDTASIPADPVPNVSPILPACLHRGEERTCCVTSMTCDLGGSSRRINAETCKVCPVPFGRLTIDPNTFITTAQLTTDTEEFRKSLPPDIDFVVGISRSGMLPASILAYHLHLPLWGVSRHAGVANMGHGLRLESRGWIEPRHILLIDDTVASGTEMTACYPIVRERFPDAKVTRAVIYARPSAIHAVDMFHAIYDGYHYLEWNWCNAGHSAACVYDFDGILCRDFTAEECHDDATYTRVMETIAPLYLPRRLPVPMIVTARPEWTREITERWLTRHSVRVEKLVMWPGKTHPPASEVAPWKAKHYAESPHQLFAESDPGQAKAIAELTRRPVLCPAAGRLFPGKPTEPPKPTSPPNIREQLEIVHECDYRGHILIPRCGCQGEWRACGLGKGDPENPGQVRLSHCLECAKAR